MYFGAALLNVYRITPRIYSGRFAVKETRKAQRMVSFAGAAI
jgi:hypothetical protein